MAKRATGVGGLTKKLRELGQKGERMAKAVIQSTGDQMVANAKRGAPVDMGALRNSISKEITREGLSYTLIVGMDYGGFVEFGTGARVSIPEDLSSEAAKFKGYKSGNFQQFLREIRDWCKRHGIDESAAYPIAVSILDKGLKPRPFVYPAYLIAKRDVVQRLKAGFARVVAEANR